MQEFEDEPLEDDYEDDPGATELERMRRESRRAVEEAGGGESEGFELAEEELVEHASHGDEHSPSKIMRDALEERELSEPAYGEADEEHKPD